MKLTSFVFPNLLAVLMVSCSGLMPASPVTQTPAPSETPTSTILWFPATNTPTEFITKTVEPTEQVYSGVGGLVFSDSFDNPDLWNTSTSSRASAIISLNRLVLSLTGQDPISITSMRAEPVLFDFYAEVTATISLCMGADQYGMVFRSASGGYYRFTLNCDGMLRLDHGTSGSISQKTGWMASGDFTGGAPGEVKIGVWAMGRELRFYLNDHFQFTSTDPFFQSGRLGFFAYANKNTPVTVAFSNLSVYSVIKFTSTPELFLTPTVTLQP